MGVAKISVLLKKWLLKFHGMPWLPSSHPILLETLHPTCLLCWDPFPPSSWHHWEVIRGWQGAWLQVQNAKYCFSSVFSPNEIPAWILFESYQVAAFIWAETLHRRQNPLSCALFLCGFEPTRSGGSRWLWVQPMWVPLKWEVRPASAASPGYFIRKWLLLWPNGAALCGAQAWDAWMRSSITLTNSVVIFFLNLLSSSVLHFQRNEKIEKPESGIEMG